MLNKIKKNKFYLHLLALLSMMLLPFLMFITAQLSMQPALLFLLTATLAVNLLIVLR